MKNSLFNLKRVSAFFIGIILFILVQPYFVWGWPIQLKLAINAVPVALFLIYNDFKSKNSNIVFFFLFLLLFVFSCIIQGISLAFSLYSISFSIFFFVDRQYAFTVYTWFRIILAICLSISLFVWVMYLVGINMPYNLIDPLNSLKPYDYIQYPFLVIENEISSLFRFFGPFDEPGVIGTICTIILFIEGYNLKDIYNIPLFIAGLCTFSLYFVLATLAFLAFKSLKNTKFIVLSIVGIAVFYFFTKDIDVFQELMYDRLEVTENNSIAGDNRATQEFKTYFDTIRGTSTYFFGADQNTISRFSGSAGYRNAILKYGFIFCFIYTVLFFIYAKKLGLSRSKMWLFAFLFLSVTYQRPGFLDPVYIFLFVEFVKINSTRYRKEPVARTNNKEILVQSY